MKAPEGEVTIVFAEGCDAANAARIGEFGGYHVKSADGRAMAAFERAAGAVAWAMEVQRDGAARIGMHAGRPICERAADGRADYFGPDVNRAARIADAGHPGQTLLSEETLRDIPENAAVVVPLGEHRLRGVDRPIRIFQATRAPRDFPPLRALPLRPTNLPAQTSSFVGRARELAEVLDLLVASPLVTVTGPAGVGKTRFAVRAASDLVDRFPGGCWMADVAEATGPEDVAAATAAALGLAALTPAAVQAACAVRPPILLVLDTFDRVTSAAAATVGAWMQASPASRFLVTSRALLGLPEERQLALGPLGDDAVRLFEERAAEAKPGFAVTPENAEAVARICEELEGIPLAIELAAARLKILTPADLVKKLGQKFQLLRASRQDISRRQQALSEAIEWSVSQLSEAEREAFLQCTVFRGGFTGEAANEVVVPGGAQAARGLREKSLLFARDGGRFDMYRSIRDWAERSAWPGRAAAQARHEAYFTRVGPEMNRVFARMGTRESHARLADETDNLLAIFERGLERGGAKGARAAAVAITTADSLLAHRLPAPALAARLERALAALQSHAPEDTGLSCLLARSLASTLRQIGRLDEAKRAAERAVTLAEALGSKLALGWSLYELAFIVGHFGDLGESYRLLDRAGTLAAEAGLHDLEFNTLTLRSAAAARFGHLDRAMDLARESIEVAARSGSPRRRSEGINALGNALNEAGRVEESLAAYREAFRFAEEGNLRISAAVYAGNAGDAATQLGRIPEALALIDGAVTIERELGRAMHLGYSLLRRAIALRIGGNPAAALAQLPEALELMRSTKNALLTGEGLQQRALARSEVGEHDAAAADALEALEVMRDSKDPMSQAEGLGSAARVMLRVGRLDEARRLAIEAGRILHEGASAPVPGTIQERPHCVFQRLAVLALAGDEGARKAALEAGESVLRGFGPDNELVREFLPRLRQSAK